MVLFLGCFLISNSANAALTDSMVSFWKLGEDSGNRIDSIGSNNLTSNNSVGQAVGKVGNAAHFTASSTQYLSVADNSGLSAGDVDFTLSGWFYLDSASGSFEDIVTKWEGPSGQREYIVYYEPSVTKRIIFAVRNSANNGGTSVSANNFGEPSLNTWYFFVVWHDSVNDTVNIQIGANGTLGTADSAAYSGGVFDGGNNFSNRQ